MDHNSFLQSIAQQVAPQSNSAGGSGGPKLQFSVPCFEVEYEEQKAPSLKYIFFDLPFPELPQRLSFHVVNGWIGGSGPIHQVIKILKPDGTVHLETPRQPLEFIDVNTPFLAVNFFPKIPFETQGLYFIVVHLEDQEVLRYPLTVRTLNEPVADSAPDIGTSAPAPNPTQGYSPFGGGGQGFGPQGI